MENNIENNQKDEVVAEVTETPTVEELQAKLAESKGFTDRLLEEKKELKAFKESIEKSKAETPATPVKKETEVDPLAGNYAMSKLIKDGLSLDEIKLAQSYVGTGLGKDLLEVSGSAGFKAELKAISDARKSDEMADIGAIELKPIETRNSMMQSIANGEVDIKDDENAKATFMQNYVEALKNNR